MIDFPYKTQPFNHQREIFEKSRDWSIAALFLEQRTGKTKIVLDTAAWLYSQYRKYAGERETEVVSNLREIDALLIVAPSGVHANWITQECPQHLPDWTSWRGMTWRSNRAGGKAYQSELHELLIHPGLAVLAVNVDALITENLRIYLRVFTKKRRILLAVDEATDVANPGARRSKICYSLASWCAYKRVLDGTPTAESPLDLYGILKVLQKHPLGFDSQQAFERTYAEWEKRVAWNRDCYRCQGVGTKNEVTCPVCEGDGRGRYSTIAVDDEGHKKWLNLDDLQKRLAPIAFRVTRADCADLPPKIYARRVFELSAEQLKVYAALRDRFHVELSQTAHVSAENVLTRYLKLQQVTCGFIQTDVKAIACPSCDGLGTDGEDACERCVGDGMIIPDGSLRPLENPKLPAIAAELGKLEGQVIIWSRFRYELGRIADLLTDSGISFVTYYGGMSLDQKEKAKVAFQEKRARVFLGNPAAAGRGLQLPARNVLYASNGFSLRQRLQSEDRPVTLADTESIGYLDFVAEGTIDELPLRAFAEKKSVSDLVLNWREWV